MLTLERANAVVIVTTEVAKLVAQHQPPGADNTSAQTITIDEAFTCTSSGTGYMKGTGNYVPLAGEGYGPTTFDVMVSLDNCGFSSAPVSAGLLGVRGPVQTGTDTSNLTFRGDVMWPPGADTCTITMKVYGMYYSSFMGTVCAYGVTPQTINSLPP